MAKQLTEGDVIALAAAVAGSGGGGTGDGDMKKATYDSDSAVADAGGISNYVATEIGDAIGELGSLASKDKAEGAFTPLGSISVSQGTDSTTTVNSITNVGTLPSLSVEGEAMTFNPGTLPTKSADTTVVTASGTRSATFTGSEGTVEVS